MSLRVPRLLVPVVLATSVGAQIGVAPPEEVEVLVEDFTTDARLDRDRSSGAWAFGIAFGGSIGGDGLHGDFDVTLGTDLGGGVYEWNVDNFLIPADRTLSGRPERVTDGVFRFTTFVLPRGAELRFVGFELPRLYVRGNVDIAGTIDVSGAGAGEHEGDLVAGQRGAQGGPFAGRGGKGGDKNVAGTGPSPIHNGASADAMFLPGGHAYAARAVGTEGRGSVEWPASGLVSDVQSSFGLLGVSLLTAAGGGGGGYRGAGAPGRVVSTFADIPSDQGPDSVGGVAYDPFPLPGPATVFDHFLVGGAGGGGGASHAFGSRNQLIRWLSGAGGGGGGGPLGLRVGRDASIQSTGRIDARGGDGGSSVGSIQSAVAPGGGGSGGSVVLQVEGRANLMGLIDVTGGRGGRSMNRSLRMETVGGNGAPGYIRLERPGSPSVGELGTTLPPSSSENVAPLREADAIVGSSSLWRRADTSAPRDYVRYVIRAIINGQPVLYSDDPTYRDPALPWLPNLGLATDGQAIVFFAQGANVAADGTVDDASVRPWRRLVRRSRTEPSLGADQRNGVRFTLLFDRRVATGAVVDVQLFYIPR